MPERSAVANFAAGAAVGVVALLAFKRASKYVPAKVWKNKVGTSKFASMNRPTAGARTQKDLPVGKHPVQLYSMATPNGVKVTIFLEELCDLDASFEYDAWPINIMQLDQFTSGFVAVNPNSKIPALVDNSSGTPIRVFESGAILLHLAETTGKFLSKDPAKRAETISWVMWQMGAGPYLGGGFGHFYAYAPKKIEYAIDRFAMEAKRQLDVLDKQLAQNTYIAGEEYTIADMAIWPWYGILVLGKLYGAKDFLDVASYTHVVRWAKLIEARAAVQRGRKVNRSWGEKGDQLPERHARADFANL